MADVSALRSVAWTRRWVAGDNAFGLRRCPFPICASLAGFVGGVAI
ncbi:hypothetical protein WDY80_05145 [Gordonia hongkongensis]